MSRIPMSWVVLLGLLCPILVSCTNPYSPAGHEGYVFERPRVFGKGGFRGMVQGPGNYGMSVFRNEIINIDMRPTTYTEQFKILTSDDLNISFRFHSVLALEPGSVQKVVLEYGGEQWYARYVKEPFRTFVRDAVQNPEIVSTAVEQKLAAQQLLEEKATQKEIAQRDAEIRIEEAKGIAEAQRIINSTLTSNYLQHEAIGAQQKMAASPNHTTVYIPVGANGMPLVFTPKH